MHQARTGARTTELYVAFKYFATSLFLYDQLEMLF